MTHLSRDVAAADDHHRRRQRVDPHDRVGGVERNVVQADDLGDARPGADCEHDSFAAELLPVDLEHPGSDEAGLADVHIDPTPAPGLDRVLRRRIDAREDAVADGGPVGADQLGADPVAAGVADRLGDIGRVHQHLRRDAAAVEAGTAEPIALDDRDTQTVEARGREHVAGPRADDHQVVVGHRRRIRAAGGPRWVARAAVGAAASGGVV